MPGSVGSTVLETMRRRIRPRQTSITELQHRLTKAKLLGPVRDMCFPKRRRRTVTETSKVHQRGRGRVEPSTGRESVLLSTVPTTLRRDEQCRSGSFSKSYSTQTNKNAMRLVSRDALERQSCELRTRKLDQASSSGANSTKSTNRKSPREQQQQH